jgi:hypothetical protein
MWPNQYVRSVLFLSWIYVILLDCKLSPCVKCNMFPFWCLLCVWVLIADVSEHSISSIFKDLPLKMEPIECSETSAISTQTPKKHLKENILHYVILLNFSHFPSTCSSPSFSSDTFQIGSEVFKLEHYTEIYSKRSMPLPFYSAISLLYIFLIPMIITGPGTSKYAIIITIINIVFIIVICTY